VVQASEICRRAVRTKHRLIVCVDACELHADPCCLVRLLQEVSNSSVPLSADMIAPTRRRTSTSRLPRGSATPWTIQCWSRSPVLGTTKKFWRLSDRATRKLALILMSHHSVGKCLSDVWVSSTGSVVKPTLLHRACATSQWSCCCLGWGCHQVASGLSAIPHAPEEGHSNHAG
jgi:hypothetical protein